MAGLCLHQPPILEELADPECVDTPSGPGARVARWHETFSKFDLSVVYVLSKDNTIIDVLSQWVYPASRALQHVSVHGDAKETELAKRLIAFERHREEGIINPEVKCFVVQSKRAPTAHMIRSVVASFCCIARPSAPSVPLVFSADNDVLTQDWGPAYAKCPDFGGLFDPITSAPQGGEGDNDRWPKDVTVQGDKIFKAGRLLVPKDMSEKLVSQWHKTTALHAGAKKLQQSTEARLKSPN